MRRTEAIAWVLGVCANCLRLSQLKTLSELVSGALKVERVSLAEIGRNLLGAPSAKHKIKRTWRFVANHRIEASDAMRGVIRRLVKRRKRPLLMALDWTEIRGFCTLMAAAVMKGRAIPLLWTTYPKWQLYKSQNNLEEGLLYLLRSMIPESVPVILLADRGFGRTDLARLCQQRLQFHYVIRISPDVWVSGRDFCGKLLDLPVRRGVCRLLRQVDYRKERPVRQHVVVRWKVGLPKHRDECWFLMTDLDRSPRRLTELYGRRMTVEELFRDDKNKRNGFALRNTQITRADRIDRLLLILALAYILLLGLGLIAQRQYRPGTWSSRNQGKPCSAFIVGRIMLERMRASPAQVFIAVASALETAPGKWG